MDKLTAIFIGVIIFEIIVFILISTDKNLKNSAPKKSKNG